jgi:hypothetical protein
VKERDHCMDATRYLVVSGLSIMQRQVTPMTQPQYSYDFAKTSSKNGCSNEGGLMSWIDDGLNKRKAEKDRTDRISASASILYENVWTEIARCVKEANTKGIAVFIDATQHQSIHNRTVSLSLPLEPMPRQLHVKLSNNHQAIEITGSGKPMKLDLDICVGGHCLKHNGKPISVEKAAQEILQPFFFPELFA